MGDIDPEDGQNDLARELGLVRVVDRPTVEFAVGDGQVVVDVGDVVGMLIPDLTRGDPGVVEVTDDCVGCGVCADGVCFVNAITIENGRARSRDDCRGCSNCVEACPQGAIRVVIESSDYIENAIRRLSEAVDVG